MTPLLVGIALSIYGMSRLFEDSKGSGRGMTTFIITMIGGYLIGVGLNT